MIFMAEPPTDYNTQIISILPFVQIVEVNSVWRRNDGLRDRQADDNQET